MPDSPPAPPAAPSTGDAARRQRERIDRLLAQSDAQASGQVTLRSGQVLDYTLAAGFLPVPGKALEAAPPQAAVMATSYTLPGATPGGRPVCFAFNGGPGASSIWLHLGALGPKRVVVPDDGSAAPPPHAVVDNPETGFEAFDLVFVDPPHTGWSVAADDDARKLLCSVDGDVAAMADTLLDQGVNLAGLVLVSCALDLQSLCFDPGNELPFALFLPAFANTAQYHGLLKGTLGASPEGARRAAEDFVAGDHVAALHAGARLDARARASRAGLPR